MDDLKLLGRNKNDLKNEIKVVHTISKDLNLNFRLENVQVYVQKEVGSKAKCI